MFTTEFIVEYIIFFNKFSCKQSDCSVNIDRA